MMINRSNGLNKVYKCDRHQTDTTEKCTAIGGEWLALEQCFSTFLLPRNPEQAWRSLTEPHALIHESSDVCEDEATGCLRTHFPSRAKPLWRRQSKQRWPIL